MDDNAIAAGEPPHRPSDPSISEEPIEPRTVRKAQKCPQCGLVNPPEAQRCDCGWDFLSQRQEKSFLEPKHQAPPHTGKILGAGEILLIAYLAYRLIHFLVTIGNL